MTHTRPVYGGLPPHNGGGLSKLKLLGYFCLRQREERT